MTLIVVLGLGQRLIVLEDPTPAAQLTQQINASGWTPDLLLGKDTSSIPSAGIGHLYNASQVGDYVVVTESTAGPDEAGKKQAPLLHVSPRECQVLIGLGEGATFQQIALRLHISERTVQAYVASLKTRLNVQSIGQLVGLAALSGIIKPKPDLSK